MLPIRNIQRSLDAAEVSDQTIKAEEAFHKIKRRLVKFQMLVVPKEGEVLMVCLQPRSEAISSNLFVERNEVVTNGPMKEILKISGTEGRLVKWAVELRTYHISYVQRKEAEGQVVKKFFGQGEQVLRVSDKNNKEASISKEKPQDKLVLAPTAWRLYVGREPSKEGSRVPRTKETKKCMEEIMDATAPFHTFWITYLPKALNPKAESLTELAFIRLEFLNQEVPVGIKTRPSVEAAERSLGEARNVSKIATAGKLSHTWEDHNESY
ncbi:hypothetical protein Tco_0920325 [Tanacetum coccineum]